MIIELKNQWSFIQCIYIFNYYEEYYMFNVTIPCQLPICCLPIEFCTLSEENSY